MAAMAKITGAMTALALAAMTAPALTACTSPEPGAYAETPQSRPVVAEVTAAPQR